MSKADLTNSTFIIPIKLESQDRIANFSIVIKFLTKYLDTNIIIYEQGTKSVAHNLPKIHSNIKYLFERITYDEPFHRTKYLNHMIRLSQTLITVNYDLDILLPIESLLLAQDLILNKDLDMIFPFGYGNFQKNVDLKIKSELFNSLESSEPTEAYNIMNQNSKTLPALYGHVQFFKTSSYIEGGMENEGFISYGPEDLERACRFLKLGYKVSHLVSDNSYVYHLDHERGKDSSKDNPFFHKNAELYNHLLELEIPELKKYYNIT
jgi:predicted glycosyltransferase involved in capsule biosynthesis